MSNSIFKSTQNSVTDNEGKLQKVSASRITYRQTDSIEIKPRVLSRTVISQLTQVLELLGSE